MTGDPERGVGEMVRTYLTDTPPVEEGESQSRVILEELGWFCCEITVGADGEVGGSVRLRIIDYEAIICLTCNDDC